MQKQWKKWLSVSVLAGAMFVLAACGGGGGGGNAGGGDTGGGDSGAAATDGVVVVQVDESSGFKFVPANISAKAGEEITVRFENNGAVAHDWTVKGLDQDVTSGTLSPGESKEITFTAPATGEYKIVCEEPGHEAAGMVGTLKVE